MKKIAVWLMAALMLFAFNPLQAGTVSEPLPKSAATMPIAVKTAESEELLLRIDEIHEMDKSDLNFAEKKVLRKEVRSIKSELKQRGGGIYLSVGAAIIIVILLIILL